MSHTPGPWHVGKRDPEWLPIRDANDLWVCDCGFRNEVSENEANARLIAAAPDLLSSVKDLLFIGNLVDEERQNVITGAVAAIKKAEGQS